jgi:Icc-related predicted phosphoesterase
MTNSPLKLLLFSDLHANARAAEALARRAAEFDIVIGAGDFGNARRDLRVTIDVLKLIDRPTILVAGNNESTDELRDACLGWPSATVLHGNSVEISGVTFYGLGGGVPVTPFGDWSYDLTEEQAGSLLAACPARSVLISHSPPKGVVDVSSQGKSLGSTAVRDAIVRTSPLLVVCGHIHACAGRQEMLGETPVVNAGPSGVEWELNRS